MNGQAFHIYYQDLFLGSTDFEMGDAPMGCAEGKLYASIGLSYFKAYIPPAKHSDPDMPMWCNLGLTARIGNKEVVPCIDLVITDFPTLQNELPMVNIVGIDSGLYEELFPHHCAAYDAQFNI